MRSVMMSAAAAFVGASAVSAAPQTWTGQISASMDVVTAGVQAAAVSGAYLNRWLDA